MLTRLLTSRRCAAVADRCVECADLVAGVGDDELVAVGADRGQGCRAFDLAGMDDDLAAFEKGVEDLTRPLTSPHEQAEVGVRGIAEPVDRLELVVRFGSHPACGEVEDAAAADGRELVAVAEERDGWRAARSAMANSARAVSWSSMPASSTRRTSPGSRRARASGAASVCDQCPSSSQR